MMSQIFNKIISLFYNPSRHAKKDPRIHASETAMFMKGARFSFFSSGGKIYIGDDSLVGCNFILEHPEAEIRIGKGCFINSGSSLIAAKEIFIGDHVTIAWGASIYDHNSHSLSWIDRAKDNELQIKNFRSGFELNKGKQWPAVKRRPIKIDSKAWIGFNSIILNGVTIGEGAVVSAGSVVREDVPPWTVVSGNPAIPIKTIREQ